MLPEKRSVDEPCHVTGGEPCAHCFCGSALYRQLGCDGCLVLARANAGVMTMAASYLGPVTVGAHHVVQSTYMFFCTCGDAVSQAAQSFLPGVVGSPDHVWHLVTLSQMLCNS